MKLTADTLAKHLEGRLLPAYLVAGDEPLLCAEAADAIRAKARAMGFTERDVHFIERASGFDDVRASAGSMSLFAERRILEIRMPTGKPGVAGAKILVELLGRDDPDTLVLVLTGRLEREAQNSEWVKAIDAKGAMLSIWPIDAGRLPAWIAARCRAAGLQPTDDAIEMLVERTEGNLLAAQQEIAKLALLATDRRIDARAVIAAVADSARFDVFELGESVFGGDAQRALRILAALRAEGAEPTLVLWSLLRELRGLWALARGGAEPFRGKPRPPALLERARRRAPKLPHARLAARASRVDRVIKGRARGEAWDELSLLASEACGVRSLPLSRPS